MLFGIIEVLLNFIFLLMEFVEVVCIMKMTQELETPRKFGLIKVILLHSQLEALT